MARMLTAILAIIRSASGIQRTVLLHCSEVRDVKRGQMLEAEAEAKHLRPRSRPRPEPRGRGRGHNLEAEVETEVEAEAKFNRPNPRTKLKRPNRTLYFTMKINEYMP